MVCCSLFHVCKFRWFQSGSVLSKTREPPSPFLPFFLHSVAEKHPDSSDDSTERTVKTYPVDLFWLWDPLLQGALQLVVTAMASPNSNGACSLQNSIVDMGILRDDALNELTGILDDEAPTPDSSDDSTDGPSKLTPLTCLVLDPLLQGALQLVVTEGPKMFKQHSVKDLVELSWFPLATACKTVIYLVRPNVESMKQVSSCDSSPTPPLSQK